MSRLLFRSRLFSRMRYRLNIHSGSGHTYNKRYFSHQMINALARYLTSIFLPIVRTYSCAEESL